MVPWSTQELRVSASFGASQWDLHEPYTQAFKRADAALYTAKRAGRDCVVVAGDDPSPSLFNAPESDFEQSGRDETVEARANKRSAAGGA